MFRMTLAAAALLVPFSATGALAQDGPRWDPMVEQALIDRLQPKLPQMRPAYDLLATAALPQLRKPRSSLEELATMDATRPHLRKYTGRIVWM